MKTGSTIHIIIHSAVLAADCEKPARASTTVLFTPHGDLIRDNSLAYVPAENG